MKTGDDLFQLIRSLSEREKRSFLRSEKNSKGGEKNVLLFQDLSGREEYEENTIKRELKGKAFTSQFAVAKLRLKDRLLTHLSSTFYKNRPDFHLADEVKSLRILLEKGVYKQAYNLVKKLKKEALRQSIPTAILDLLIEESRIVRILGGREIEKRLEKIHQEASEIHEIMQEEWELMACYDKLFLFIRQNVDTRTKDDELKLTELKHKVDTQLKGVHFFQNQRIKLHFFSFFFHLKGEKEAVYTHQMSMLNLWRNWPKRIEMEPLGYLKTCREVLENASEQGDWGAFKSIRSELNDFRSNSELVKFKCEQIKLQTDLNKVISLFEFEHIQSVENSFLQLLKSNPMWVDSGFLVTIQFNLFTAFFLNYNFKKAEKWRRLMEVEGHKSERKDIKEFARIAEILILFELGDDMRFEQSLRNHRRFFKRSVETYLLELKFLAIIQENYFGIGFHLELETRNRLLLMLEEFIESKGDLPLGWPLVKWWLENPVEESGR